jgi:hypothetical protein
MRIAGAIAALVFALYALSAPRTVSHEDDGMFVLSSYFLGIEHPPGYPLFIWIGHLFTYLPVGSVAYRVHLASALFGALSCGLLYLCARALIAGRLPALLAASGLAMSPVFWSQAIIAEVYTLNTFFFLALVWLGLTGGSLRWMALVFGLSLSNHYPLMLLAAPAFGILLWPRRAELVRELPLCGWLVVLGLLPYAWLVVRSWAPLPISFYGPLDTLPEIWYFISRTGYAGIDQSSTAGWLDRLKFFQFQGLELFVQFALIGTLLAAAGFAVQWRAFGRRISWFLTAAFLLPTAGLLLLLGFDYDSIRKHVFHVYPLPAYAVAALWMGLGFAWVAQRYALRPMAERSLAAVVAAAIFALGARANLLEDHEWGARYARAMLAALPKNAIVLTQGDPDLAPMGYFHLIENVRPDITLYHVKGLMLGNRLFHAVRTDYAGAQRILEDFVERQTDPVVSTMGAWLHGAQRARFLYSEVDKSAADPKQVTVELTEEAMRFFEESLAQTRNSNAWVQFIQSELRRQYGVLLARALVRGELPDARTRRHFELLQTHYAGALGTAEGLMANPAGYSTGAVAVALDKARDLMPADVSKEHLSRFFYIRGALRSNMGDPKGGIADLETAVFIWQVATNPAIVMLEDMYRDAGDEPGLKALQERVKAFKVPQG